MTKIVITANDTKEEIEEKIREGFSFLGPMLDAFNKHMNPYNPHVDPSSKGKTPDSESDNEGSNPSGSATS